MDPSVMASFPPQPTILTPIMFYQNLVYLVTKLTECLRWNISCYKWVTYKHDKIIQLYLEYKDANKSTLFLPKSWVYCRPCLIRFLYFSTDVWCCESFSLILSTQLNADWNMIIDFSPRSKNLPLLSPYWWCLVLKHKGQPAILCIFRNKLGFLLVKVSDLRHIWWYFNIFGFWRLYVI